MLTELRHAPERIPYTCASGCGATTIAKSYQEIVAHEKLCDTCYRAKHTPSLVREVGRQRRIKNVKVDNRKTHVTCLRCSHTGVRTLTSIKPENCTHCHSEKSVVPTSTVETIILTPERSGSKLRGHYKDVLSTLLAIGDKFPALKEKPDFNALPEFSKFALLEHLDYTSLRPNEVLGDQQLLALAVHYSNGVPSEVWDNNPTQQMIDDLLLILPQSLIVKIHKHKGTETIWQLVSLKHLKP